MSNHPRGIANNNPGNIRYTGTAWKGLADPPSDRTPHKRGMCRFISPVYGLRAMAKNLLNYQDRYGLRTVAGIVSRWAPPVENHTPNYINRVCKDTGFNETQELNLYDPAVMEPLMRAMIAVENGNQYHGYYSAAVFDKALAEAGLSVKAAPETEPEPEPAPPRPKAEKAKDVAKDVATGGGVASAFILFIREALEAGADLPLWLVITGIVFGLSVTGYLIWKRWRK